MPLSFEKVNKAEEVPCTILVEFQKKLQQEFQQQQMVSLTSAVTNASNNNSSSSISPSHDEYSPSSQPFSYGGQS